MPNRNLFVTTDTALDTGTVAYTDPSLVADGALAVLDSEDASGGSADLSGTALPAKFTIVRGGEYPQIENLEKAKINKVVSQAFRAEVKQKTAVGYNGTSGSLANDSGVASIKLIRKEFGYEPFPRVNASTSTKATPYATANELVKQFNNVDKSKLFGSQTRKFVDAEVISDITTTESQDISPAAITGTVVKGSKTVVTSAAINTASVGETLRIGSVAGTSDPVFVIVAINGTSITLDRAYSGASASGVLLGDGPAPSAGDAVGVVLTGVASIDGEPAISFETAIDDVLINDIITSLATPQTANGSTAMLKNLEEFSWGNRSYYYTNYFPQTPDSNVVAGVNYDLVTLIYENNSEMDSIVSANKYREIHVAYPEGNITLATLKAFFES